MAIKRYVEGQGWVEIANNSSSSGKAVNIKVSDSDGFYDSDNVEGVLNEIAYDIKQIKRDLNDHETNHPSGGDPGPGTGGILPTITSDFEITSSDGESNIEIPIFFTSPNLGDGTCYVLVNNIEVKMQTVTQGNNTIIVPPIGAGKNIPVSIYVKDRAGLISNQLTWIITAGGLSMTMRTNLKADFSYSSPVSLSYVISCISTDDIFAYFTFKGYDYTNGTDVDKTIEIKSINGFNSCPINTLTSKELGVGAYSMEYWAVSGDYATNKQTGTLVIVDEDTLLISVDFDTEKEYESGIPITIPYRVSIDRDEDFTVELYVDDVLYKTLKTRPAYLYWTITSLDIGSHNLKIKAYSETLQLDNDFTFQCKVIAGEYARIQPIIDASLLCWFDATDKTNDDQNRDIWYDKICGNRGQLYNFNYGNNGWLKEDNSNYAALYMNGVAYVEFDMTPFENNFKDGATIELVFKTSNIGDMNARVLDITDTTAPFKGVYIDTREAYISTAAQTIYASIGEDEFIHVMYQIDRENKYIHVIINGVITKSCKLSDSGSGTSAILESVQHVQKMYLNGRKGEDLFGSCAVKHLRIYDRVLSFEEILQNYLSTIEDITTQKAKADFNDAAKRIMPVMMITGDENALKNMTDTTIAHDISISYYSPNEELYGATLLSATNCDMYWQGTSSMSYNIHNYNIVLMDENRQKIDYSPYPDCIPQSLFCLKANLMESTNAHNVGLAEYVRKYLYTKNNPAMDIDPKASRTVQGFPILLYINEKFEGLYDFNLDRYSTKAFGYELPHRNCKVYEIGANTNFTAGAFIPWTADTGVDEWTWYKNDFKGIYPPEIIDPVNDDFAELKELISFVHDSNDEVFRTNFSTYFDKESVIRYYILVMVLGLVDSLGKNAKLVTYDGVKWYFEFYDMDTAMGLSNTGTLEKDVDIEMEIAHFNTAESKLWTRIREQFDADIKQEYYNMRLSTLTLDHLYECLFTNQIEKIPEYQYNLSTQAKYLADGGAYLGMSNGNRYYGLKRWLSERLLFCDTLFGYSPTTDSYVQIRSSILGKVSFEIETYSPMYFKVRWRNQLDGSADEVKKIGRGEKIKFEGTILSNDQEIFLYCAPHIKQIGGMDQFSPLRLFLNNASRLIALECPDCTGLNELQIGQCTYLQRIDFKGCSALGSLNGKSVLDVSGCSNLKYLNAYGTSLTSITLNSEGGNLVELYVPYTLQLLELRNQYSLRIVGIPGANTLDTTDLLDIRKNSSSITSFTMINCPLVERLVYDDNFVAGGIFFDNYANERRGTELNAVEYKHGSWKNMMNWGNGLANCDTIHIENSCYNVPAMSFRSVSQLTNLTLRDMPHLKALMIGANCCGYRNSMYASNDVYSEFDWENGLTIKDCPAIEEFRIHEMYPNNYLDGKTGNLTYFTFKSGTDSLKLSDKFPNLKLFECNMITQNIHQIILPQTLETLITCAWHKRHDEGFANEAKIAKFNIDSIFFEGEHDVGYIGVDLGNHEMTDTRIVAPYATQLTGINIKNYYVNPVFNELKEKDSADRPFVTPNGKIDVSEFKWRAVSDWFAYMDFTQSQCEIITPDNWDSFLNNITRADNMFRYCTNPEFTWEFAMKFFPKINNMTGLCNMYQYAQLAEQTDFETDGVELRNTYNINGYYGSAYPFIGSNLKFIKSLTLTALQGIYGMFSYSSLVKIGDITFSGSTATMGINSLFSYSKSLEEIGNITSTNAKAGGTTVIPMNNTFEGCSSLTKIGTINIAADTMDSTYSGCSKLTTEGVNLPDTTHTTDISSIFRNCASLTEMVLDNINNVVQADYMFRGCTKLTKITLPTIGPDSLLQEIQYAFANCSALKEIVLGGESLPKEIRNMSYTFQNCKAITKLPPLPDFSYDVDMSYCCAGCDSLTDDNMYKEIPFRVTDVTNMYYSCDGLLEPVVNVNTNHVVAKQMFRACPNMTSLTVNFTGTLLEDSVKFAEGCNKLTTVNFKFPSSLLMNDHYHTGVTYYYMFQNCPNLKEVNLDMSKLADSNTKADFGGMFNGNKYIETITGLDFTYLKKPDRSWSSSQGGGSYDSHDVSITYGGGYDYLTTFEPVGLLGLSYDFKNITKLDHTKTILRHLDVVTSETLGVTYNIADAINDEKTENVDEELRTLALTARDNGWSFAMV